LLVVRHGETEWNVEERFQGYGDSPLTDKGQRQAAALGRRMKAMSFDALVSSDLGRARQTAGIIADHTGHAVETDRRLRERHYGVLEGLQLPDIEAKHPEVLAQLKTDDPDYTIPGGESHREHYERNVAFVEEVVNERFGKKIALVVHGGVLDSMFRFVARLPLRQPRCFVATNTSLSVLSYGRYYDTMRWVIETWGDVGHLDGIGHYQGLG